MIKSFNKNEVRIFNPVIKILFFFFISIKIANFESQFSEQYQYRSFIQSLTLL